MQTFSSAIICLSKKEEYNSVQGQHSGVVAGTVPSLYYVEFSLCVTACTKP